MRMCEQRKRRDMVQFIGWIYGASFVCTSRIIHFQLKYGKIDEALSRWQFKSVCVCACVLFGIGLVHDIYTPQKEVCAHIRLWVCSRLKWTHVCQSEKWTRKHLHHTNYTWIHWKIVVSLCVVVTVVLVVGLFSLSLSPSVLCKSVLSHFCHAHIHLEMRI